MILKGPSFWKTTSVLALEHIYVNGGARGFLIGIAPADLAQVLAQIPVEVGLVP